MEAIRAKDRATAKKIVRKMEKRAKARPVDNLKALPAKTRTLPANGEIGNGRSSFDKTENIKATHNGGTSSTYRLGKIKRDHPELAERIMAGEFKSVSEV